MEILHFAIDPAIAEAAIRGLATAFGKTITEFGINLLGKPADSMLDTAGKLTEAAENLAFLGNILKTILSVTASLKF